MLAWGDEPYFTMGRLQKISKQAKSDTDALTDTAQDKLERILTQCSSILTHSYPVLFHFEIILIPLIHAAQAQVLEATI